jgi:hypothetical protein
MRARVAIATVQGKVYFLVVNELRRRNIPFVSLIPWDPVRVEIKAVITTKEESPLISHHKILVYNPETEPYVFGAEVVKILRGKEIYDHIVIGVDPGQVFGLSVIADEVVVDMENCFSVKETLAKIKDVLKTVDFSRTAVTVKIGSGVPVYRELLELLDDELTKQVSLEIVGEAGTNLRGEAKNRRGLRHMVSATRIARRPGYVYPRKEPIEYDN